MEATVLSLGKLIGFLAFAVSLYILWQIRQVLLLVFAAVIFAVVSFIGLLILGVPLALANGIIAGLLEFIPNSGPVLSVIPPMVVAALLVSPGKAVAVLILYIVIQQLEAYVLVPFVMKQQVELLPAVTLLAVVIFGSLFGFLGVFLAVPLVIVSKIWIYELLIKDILNHWDNNEKGSSSPEDAIALARSAKGNR